MPLSDAKLRSLKPGPKPYKVSDGHGLHVLVTPAGGRLWRLSYRYNGKQKTVALGAYPVVGLLDARERALGARKRLEAGQDPSAGKSRHRAAGSTFGEVAAEWIEMQLAHVQGGVRGIYNAAKYLDGRRAMMQWWADFLDRKANDDIDDLL